MSLKLFPFRANISLDHSDGCFWCTGLEVTPVEGNGYWREWVAEGRCP